MLRTTYLGWLVTTVALGCCALQASDPMDVKSSDPDPVVKPGEWIIRIEKWSNEPAKTIEIQSNGTIEFLSEYSEERGKEKKRHVYQRGTLKPNESKRLFEKAEKLVSRVQLGVNSGRRKKPECAAYFGITLASASGTVRVSFHETQLDFSANKEMSTYFVDLFDDARQFLDWNSFGLPEEIRLERPDPAPPRRAANVDPANAKGAKDGGK